MQYLEKLTEEERAMVISEFIISVNDIQRENLHMEILSYLRRQNIKTENPEIFSDFFNKVEEKIL